VISAVFARNFEKSELKREKSNRNIFCSLILKSKKKKQKEKRKGKKKKEKAKSFSEFEGVEKRGNVFLEAKYVERDFIGEAGRGKGFYLVCLTFTSIF